MEIIALALWVLTALGGFVMLGIWVQRGGVRQQRTGTSRFPAPVLFGHLGLAAAGLVAWVAYVLSDTDALAWVAFGLLLPVALLGFTMFARWRAVRRGAVATTVTATAEAEPTDPAERHLPVPFVLLHGLAAVATVVFVLLTALGVGDG